MIGRRICEYRLRGRNDQWGQVQIEPHVTRRTSADNFPTDNWNREASETVEDNEGEKARTDVPSRQNACPRTQLGRRNPGTWLRGLQPLGEQLNRRGSGNPSSSLR